MGSTLPIPYYIIKFIMNMKKINPLNILSRFDLSKERQGRVARKTVNEIKKILKETHIDFTVENFTTYVPKISKAKLIVDGKNIPCMGCSFVSGKISSKDSVVSSLISSQYLIDKANINFNPECDSISRSNFYFAPSLAINKKDLAMVVNGRKVRAEVKVKKTECVVENLLVGNKKNPKNIVFAHYDSIGPGVVDNASGFVTVLSVIIQNQETLKDTLYVFDGNEELSYDFPVYWGHGFRVFEKKHFRIMDRAEKIVVVDCVGNVKTFSTNDEKISKLAFPIKNISKWKNKVEIVGGDIDDLMTVYHSDLDVVSKLSQKYLDDAVAFTTRILKR